MSMMQKAIDSGRGQGLEQLMYVIVDGRIVKILSSTPRSSLFRRSGKYVTVLIEETVFRVLDGDVELSTHRRTSDKPVTRFKAVAHIDR